MTTIVFYKSKGTYYGFQEHGHTGYSYEGTDILCSAISAMTMLIINAIEVSYKGKADYQIDDDTADITLIAPDSFNVMEPQKSYAISGLIYAYYCQLKELQEEYPDYLEVKEEEKSFK